MLYQVTKVMFVDGIIWSRQTINNLERIKIGAFFTQVNPSNAQNSHDCLPRPKPSTTRPIRDDQFLLCSTCVQCLRLQKGITATYFAKAGAALFHSGGSEVLNRNAWLSAGKSHLRWSDIRYGGEDIQDYLRIIQFLLWGFSSGQLSVVCSQFFTFRRKMCVRTSSTKLHWLILNLSTKKRSRTQ